MKVTLPATAPAEAEPTTEQLSVTGSLVVTLPAGAIAAVTVASALATVTVEAALVDGWFWLAGGAPLVGVNTAVTEFAPSTSALVEIDAVPPETAALPSETLPARKNSTLPGTPLGVVVAVRVTVSPMVAVAGAASGRWWSGLAHLDEVVPFGRVEVAR